MENKRDVWAKYNEISKENRGGFGEDGKYHYVLIKGGNNSGIIRRALKRRKHWAETEQPHLTLFHFKWAPVSRLINYE